MESLPELFAEASARRGEARSRWLAALREREPALAKEIEELLHAAQTFRTPLDLQPVVDLLDETPPAQIGPFRILRELGRGGMGQVFLAEQVGDGFSRRAAIKRLSSLNGPQGSERRFAEEVRILAGLEHSGIARFLDSGYDASAGRYLVLEFVEGMDLVSHARSHDLELSARLRLFLDVMAAVAYAHDQRVLHGDIKPGNVLVGADGRPKLLDFGIARLLEKDSSTYALTNTESRRFTPAYASPEQIRGARLTVASDIYSLGVMLYELLAGVRPFDAEAGDPRRHERAVLERPPIPPSTAARGRLAHTPSGTKEPRTRVISRALERDLDAICLKALRKEPEQRYPSVSAMAADLESLLAGRPVSARRGGVNYHASRYVRRHRASLSLSLAAAVAAAGLALGWEQWRYGTTSGHPPALSPPPVPTLTRIGQLSASFAEHPERVDDGIELARELLAAGRGADAVDAVTRLRQLSDDLGRGRAIDLVEAESALAISEFQRAVAAAAAARSEPLADPGGTLDRRAQLVQARALLRLSTPAEVENRLDRLVRDAQTAHDEPVIAEALFVRADAARRGARTDEAKRLLAQALPRARALKAGRLEIEILNLEGRLEGESGAVDQGLETVREAQEKARAIGWVTGEGLALATEGALLNWRGDAEEAHALLPLTVEKLRQSGNREVLLTALGNLATSSTERAELREAEVAIDEAERVAALLALPRARARVHALRAYLSEQRGDYPGARAAYDAAIAQARESDATSDLAGYLSELAWLETSEDHPAEADVAAREALKLFEMGEDRRAALEVGGVLAWAAAARGQEAAARSYLATLQQESRKGDSESANFVLLVAEAKIREALGELDAAVGLRREIIRLAATFGSPASMATHRLRLAQLLKKQRRDSEAALLVTEVLASAEQLGLVGVARDCRTLLETWTSLPEGSTAIPH